MKSKIKKDSINNSFLDDSLTNVISSGFAKYAKYIIQDRALPDVRDGLKPVQRRILYAMHGLNLYPNSNFKKSARIVGEVIGKYHPHGDSSIYEALIRMAQEWKVNLPLVDIHGNKGSIDDDPPAAMRYTETKLTKFGFELLNGIQKKIVPFIYNFDDSEYEPVILPGIVPNLLVNGAIGIAAGYATDIPPHNLNEVIDFLIAKIKNPNLTLDKIFKYLKGPDFPTGGIIKGKNGIYSAFGQGQGKIEIQSKYEFVFDKKPLIIINEIPYGVIKSKLIFELNYLVNKNKLVNVSRIYDASDRQTGLKIIIELKDQKDSQDIIDYLMSKSSLSVYYHYNSVVISQGKPIKMGILDIANAYLEHQNIVLKTKINYDLDKANKRLEIIEGLIKVKNDLFKIINAILKVKGSKIKVVELLKNNFSFTQNQAEAIAQLQLYRLSATDQITFEKEGKQLKLDIKEYQLLLSDQKIFDNYLIKHLKNIKKEFNTPRKSIIIDQEIEIKKLNVEKIVQANDVVVAITKLGYIKKFDTKYFKNQNLTSYLLKNEDKLIYLETIKNSSFLFLFTNYGHYFCIPAHKLKENRWKD
ncbi:MAG: DNA topoisomerase IV, partial [Mycoplasma sp.]|nr:DNA topoisomerase IV [Mycoplasma sp.]